MPRTEPNSLPELYLDWEEWRNAYEFIVDDFKRGPKTFSDEVLLKIHLKRIGFVGLDLDAELRHIKEGGS